MVEDTNAGAAPVEKPQEGVETVATEAPKSQSELDYEALLAAKDAELAKVREEKDNYRRGLLKAKGKIDEEETLTVEQPTDDRLRQIVREEVLSTQETRLQAEKDALVKEALKKVSELSIALKNKSQMTASGGGSAEVTDSNVEKFWTPEQLTYFKSKGLDPKKVKENFLKKSQ